MTLQLREISQLQTPIAQRLSFEAENHQRAHCKVTHLNQRQARGGPLTEIEYIDQSRERDCALGDQ